MKFGNKKIGIRTMTQEDIDRGLKEMFSGQKPVESTEYEPPKKDIKKPQLSFKPEPLVQQEEPQAFWSGEEWEQWAYAMYNQFPDMRRYLPEWFLKALQEALQQ